MLTEVISKLDRVVLELALRDAFYDMCFYEGEEVANGVEIYLQNVIDKTNTEEQDTAFFELAIPYIESSIMVYGSGLYEGTPEMIAPADKNTMQQKMGGPKGPLVGTQTLNKNREEVHKLHENEEAIWEEVANMIFMEGALNDGIKKAKTGLVKSGKKLSNVAQGGILNAQKKLQSFLTGMKIGGKPAITTPQGKI